MVGDVGGAPGALALATAAPALSPRGLIHIGDQELRAVEPAASASV
jgi:hypothetical protein